MNQEELYRHLAELSDVEDFILELRPVYSKSYWGRYFPERKLIRLYALDEDGNQYPDKVLIREGLHELTHHIQYFHIPYWTRKRGVMHDAGFWELFCGMLRKADIPRNLIEEVYPQQEFLYGSLLLEELH